MVFLAVEFCVGFPFINTCRHFPEIELIIAGERTEGISAHRFVFFIAQNQSDLGRYNFLESIVVKFSSETQFVFHRHATWREHTQFITVFFNAEVLQSFIPQFFKTQVVLMAVEFHHAPTPNAFSVEIHHFLIAFVGKSHQGFARCNIAYFLK